MTALTVDSAKNLGIVVAAVLVALMLVMAWLVKNVTAKIISVVVIGGLAFGVWTQRTSLQDCAKRVRDRVAVGNTEDVTCRFLGTDIKVNG
ncbi:MAG TPA: hypothetical protein VH761_14035 [Ilumatobacteraceae bacterium]|jgi:hypothetical protein